MRLVWIAAGLALVAASAPTAGIATSPGKKADDPDRRICKSRSVVGSRLQRVRECHTALEWEEMKLQEQVGLMRKQVNGDPGCNGGGGPSCNPTAAGAGRDTPW
jgi:hypothetical protein